MSIVVPVGKPSPVIVRLPNRPGRRPSSIMVSRGLAIDWPRCVAKGLVPAATVSRLSAGSKRSWTQCRHSPGTEHHRVVISRQGDTTLRPECLLCRLNPCFIGRKITPVSRNAAPCALTRRACELHRHGRQQARGGITDQQALRIANDQMLFLAPDLATDAQTPDVASLL